MQTNEQLTEIETTVSTMQKFLEQIKNNDNDEDWIKIFIESQILNQLHI